MSQALVATPSAVRLLDVTVTLPSFIADAGRGAADATVEFFTARIPNTNTRALYGRVVKRFCDWCEAQGIALRAVTSPVVALYLECLQKQLGIASIKAHASALRNWLDWLTQKGVLPVNPALSVRTPRHSVQEGKTPVLEREEARRLLDESMIGADLATLRDRALLSVMLFDFVRVGAVVRMRVKDFDDAASGSFIVVHEKGGKRRRLPCHHRAREALRRYLDTAQLTEGTAPLFQSMPGRSQALSGEALHRVNVLHMVKRRCAAAGLPGNICNHSFRGTGITIHLESGGKLEVAQDLAGHADIRTTRLYDRRSRKVQRAEIERVQL